MKNSGKKPFLPVKSEVLFPQQEESILKFWEKNAIFEKSCAQNAEKQPYHFYDGPPFATGLPHYGHILAGVLKDIVPRYWTMQGRFVERRFGWDCHGLPVEYEINKTLKLENRKQILALGVGNYNEACRSIVQRYSKEWKKTIQRVGRWVNMDQPYFTMDVSFMQSVWWVFHELWKKDLIYQGYKVVPYSVGLSTPLSNFEANLNYKSVQDPAITVAFPILDQPNTFFLAWTTTPWTLPSHMGLAVGKNIVYVQVREKASQKTYILAESLLQNYFQDSDLDSKQTFLGQDLIGRTYEPPFSDFQHQRAKGAFRVIHSDHVTTESGTGIVHLAPAFGEEDYTVCLQEGIPLVNPVDDDGVFTHEVPAYCGKRVKEADKQIILDLKQKGKIFRQDTLTHNYPFCWRTDTPLIYRAVSSWFVAVERLKGRLIANNQTTHWVPEHLKEGRFGKWLENARDWAISRNRFWGTPIPIWKNPEGEVICIGSQAELEKYCGKSVPDLHIEHIDSLEIPSPTGRTPLRRVEGVLDCWFESGSMPYAQWGYPAKSTGPIENHFPADFIAEGLDQTRGWFYTLLVIGTALFDRAPFKNVIVNGLILAEDGKKMSKSLKNYPDPIEVLNRHGADALRLYLIDSPVVKAQELRFSETGVKEMVRRILLRWWNSYSFFVNYANIDQFFPQGDAQKSPNLLDQWLLSRLHTLIEQTQNGMEEYRLYQVVPGLLQFIEELTNTYIRLNRRHFWQEGMPEDKRLAYETLYETLITLSRIMAPFAPFLAETIYQNLSQQNPSKDQATSVRSVHLESYPKFQKERKRPDLESAVRAMEALVGLGRNAREKLSIKAKIPLRWMRVIHRDPAVLKTLQQFEPYFQEELNIQKIEYSSSEDEFIQISAKAHFQILGPRLGKNMKTAATRIAQLSLHEILELESGKKLLICDEWIQLSDLEIRRVPKVNYPHLLTHPLVSLDLDPIVTSEQFHEGLAREVIRKIQAARKNADFLLDDRISLQLSCPLELKNAIDPYLHRIQNETLTAIFAWSDSPIGQHCETVLLDDWSIQIGITPLRSLPS